MGRHDSIDILRLYSTADSFAWNRMLLDCLRKRDINRLARTLRALQIGMDDLVKRGQSTPKIAEQFVRWSRSIENTAKEIIKIKHPNPIDNPIASLQAIDRKKYAEIKKRRNDELIAFFRKSSF